MKRFICMAIGATALAVLGSCGSASKPQEPEPQGQAIDAVHNTRNSVDWAGAYTGMIPAADGPGIDVTIELRYDDTYTLTYAYVDRDSSFTVSGTFAWDEAWSIITLDNDEVPPHYIVGEHTLTQLDMSGNVITGDLADMYILK
ncbi:MAG: copper resistance protein NlpE, partial [Spirochaetaceae bacterium]|nr:copper resistance protein NlpE [Spirochaetaceae bacterium]